MRQACASLFFVVFLALPPWARAANVPVQRGPRTGSQVATVPGGAGTALRPSEISAISRSLGITGSVLNFRAPDVRTEAPPLPASLLPGAEAVESVGETRRQPAAEGRGPVAGETSFTPAEALPAPSLRSCDPAYRSPPESQAGTARGIGFAAQAAELGVHLAGLPQLRREGSEYAAGYARTMEEIMAGSARRSWPDLSESARRSNGGLGSRSSLEPRSGGDGRRGWTPGAARVEGAAAEDRRGFGGRGAAEDGKPFDGPVRRLFIRVSGLSMALSQDLAGGSALLGSLEYRPQTERQAAAGEGMLVRVPAGRRGVSAGLIAIPAANALESVPAGPAVLAFDASAVMALRAIAVSDGFTPLAPPPPPLAAGPGASGLDARPKSRPAMPGAREAALPVWVAALFLALWAAAIARVAR